MHKKIPLHITEGRADNRIRTGGLFITSESLYQLSHIGTGCYYNHFAEGLQILSFLFTQACFEPEIISERPSSIRDFDIEFTNPHFF